jgi:hypothetical protein
VAAIAVVVAEATGTAVVARVVARAATDPHSKPILFSGSGRSRAFRFFFCPFPLN